MADDSSTDRTPHSDDPPELPPSEPAAAEGPRETADAQSDKPTDETPPGLLPLGPPVFGKWAFWITAVPFLVYWGGTVFGSYLEKTRKLEPAHHMRQVCRAMVEPVEVAIKDELPFDMAAEVLTRINLSGVQVALDDEAGSAEEITVPCAQLLDKNLNLSDLPVHLQSILRQFQKRVEHFLVLHGLVEDNDLNEVRIRYNEFRLHSDPIAMMREVCAYLADQFDEALKEVSPEAAAEVRERIDLPRLSRTLHDESWDPNEFLAACEELLSVNPDQMPPSVLDPFAQLQKYVRHLFDYLKLESANDTAEARQIHEAFLENEQQNLDVINNHLNRSWYPVNYSVACLVSLLAVIVAMPGYLKIPFRVNNLAYVVGIAGIVVWIGLWWLDDHVLHVGSMISKHSRAAFNPLEELKHNPTWMYTFLAIRMLGLVLIIPIAEEFFTRGFLMRYIEDIDWDQIPMGMATWKSVVGILVYGAIAHPGELVAALAWFGLITWMYLRTKNVWDCVIAHGLTNLLLGIYVLTTGTWELW